MLALGQGTFRRIVSHASARNGLIQGQQAGWPWEALRGLLGHFSFPLPVDF